MKIDYNHDGTRFQEKVRREKPQEESSKSAWHLFGKKDRVCPYCGEEYEFSLKLRSDRTCVHDMPSGRDPTQLTSGEQSRIGDKLGKNERAVKGRDGIIRVVETNQK